MFVSGREITFIPYIITGSMHEKMRNVAQVIYTSATLGSAERIHKTMGCVDEVAILAEKDIKSQVGTMGTRVIFPLTDVGNTGRIDAKVLDAVLRIVSTFKKALVLCNSHFDAERVIEFLQQNGQKATLYQREADSTHFANAEYEGALVAAGRFIGLDLPSNKCGVGIVTRMPYILGPVDLLTKNILEDDQYSDEKVSHRLVQGFGRCNRNPNDRAIYFMLDSRLASDILGDERIYQHFPRRMKAELDFGQEFAEVGGLAKAIEAGQLVLTNKLPNLNEEIADRFAGVSDKRIPVFKKPYLEEVRGWNDLTERRSYLDAANRFQNCITHYEKLKGIDHMVKRQVAWLNYLVANCLYLAHLFFQKEEYKKEAIKHLELAMQSGYTSWFSGLQVVVNELREAKQEEEAIFNVEVQSFKESLLRKWNEFYSSNSIGKRNPFEAWERMRQNLTSGTHDSVCDTLEDVLELIGFEITVIKRAQGKPDLILFSSAGNRYISIIEVKTKETSDVLKVEDIDQIGGHRAQYQTKYPDRPVYPMIFTNKGEISREAVEKAKGNVRILRNIECTTFMSRYIELMEKGWKIDDPAERLAFMEKMPSLDRFEVVFKPSTEPLVSLDDMNSIV
jgi:tetratricopeptide (TPR) repeat protein